MHKSSSITFKLVGLGILIVVIPLIFPGFISYYKSSNTLMELSKKQTENIAVDLDKIAENILSVELILQKRLHRMRISGDKKKLKNQGLRIPLNSLMNLTEN